MKTHHRRKKNGARRMSYKAVCWELQEKLLLLQHQHREQLQARSSLANKSLLLNGWMHCLDLLSDAGPSGGSENADILQELLQELQQQLGMQQGVPGATTAAAPDAEGTASLLLPIAPREDPSAYFRQARFGDCDCVYVLLHSAYVLHQQLEPMQWVDATSFPAAVHAGT